MREPLTNNTSSSDSSSPSRFHITLPFVSSIFAIAGGSTGIIVNLYLIAQLISVGWQPNISLLMWYLLGTNFSFMLLALFFGIRSHYVLLEHQALQNSSSNTIEELERRIGDIEGSAARFEQRVIRIMHNLESISAHKTGVTDYLLECDQRTDCDPKQVKKRCTDYVGHTLTHVREIFTIYTDCECSACVKLFAAKHPFGPAEASSSPQIVQTFRRDGVSYTARRRDSDADAYPYGFNTGFSSIIDDPNTDDYFVHNDLKSLGAKYRNSNPHWSDYYNATAVTPIKDPAHTAKDGIIAFLCVDNKDGRFDGDFSKAVLTLVSNNLYYVFRNTLIIMQRLNQRTTRGQS